MGEEGKRWGAGADGGEVRGGNALVCVCVRARACVWRTLPLDVAKAVVGEEGDGGRADHGHHGGAHHRVLRHA